MGLRELAIQAVSIVWPMGGVLSGSFLLAWATEVVAFFLSRGLAFAVLAFLQVLPEFAVEAVITYSASQDPSQLHFISANFTGANRLIVGLFLPLVFFVAAYRARRVGQTLRVVELPSTSSIEVLALLAATIYSFTIPILGQLDIGDAVALGTLYGVYLWMVYKLPPESETHVELPYVARTIRSHPIPTQKKIIAAFFVLGGFFLFVSVHPFYENTKELALVLGISTYFLVQWLAPLLSEFPELVTIMYWGKTGREQLGITNAVSSKVNQWTILLGMIPLIYAYGTYRLGAVQWAVPFDDIQRVEITLTAAQGLFAGACLVDLRIRRWQAWTLFALWSTQLFDPIVDDFINTDLPALAWSPFGTGAYVREWYIFVYFALTIFLIWRVRGRFRAFHAFLDTWRTYMGHAGPRMPNPTPPSGPAEPELQ